MYRLTKSRIYETNKINYYLTFNTDINNLINIRNIKFSGIVNIYLVNIYSTHRVFLKYCDKFRERIFNIKCSYEYVNETAWFSDDPSHFIL